MQGSEKFGLETYRLCPLGVKELDSWKKGDDEQVCSMDGEAGWGEPVTVKQTGIKTLIKW
jgi:hypothetical protein